MVTPGGYKRQIFRMSTHSVKPEMALLCCLFLVALLSAGVKASPSVTLGDTQVVGLHVEPSHVEFFGGEKHEIRHYITRVSDEVLCQVYHMRSHHLEVCVFFLLFFPRVCQQENSMHKRLGHHAYKM